MIGAPEPKKLTLLEKNLQQAAAQVKYETFFHHLQTLKKLNGGKLSTKQFQDIFCDPQYNVLKGLMRLSKYAHLQAPISNHAPTIVIILLNEMQQLGISLNEAKHGRPAYYDLTTKQLTTGGTIEDISPIRVHEWAAENEFIDVLSHPLVQRELINDEIQSIYLAGDLRRARSMFREQQVEYHLNEGELFNVGSAISIGLNAGAAPGFVPLNDKIKDELYTDLLDHHNISLPELIANVPPMTHEALNNFSKVKATLAYKVYDAMRTMEMEAAPPNTPKAVKLLEQYLGGISDLESKKSICQHLFYHFINMPGWTPAPAIPAPLMTEKRNLMVTLLKEMRKAGAKNIMPLNPPHILAGMQAYLPLDQMLSLDDNSGEILAYPEIFASLASMPSMESNMRINQLMNQMQPNLPPPFQMAPNIVALKALCEHAKPCFTLEAMMMHLRPHAADPHDPNFAAINQDADNFDKAVAMLIANHLIENLDQLKPGSHALPAHFTNQANPGQAIDLYQYIQDNPILKRAYEKQKRDEALLEEYSLIKAVLGEESRTEDELRRIDSGVSPIQHGDHQHTLGAIRDFIRGAERAIVPGGADIAAEVFKHLNQADVSEGRRERTVNRMANIADRANRPASSASDNAKPIDDKGKKHRP